MKLEDADSVYIYYAACYSFPETFSDDCCYHRFCFKKLTAHIDRLGVWKTDVGSSLDGSVKKRRRCSKEPECVLFSSDCIFCGKFRGLLDEKVLGSRKSYPGLILVVQ